MNITDSNMEYAFKSLVRVALESFKGERKQEILQRFIEILKEMQDKGE